MKESHQPGKGTARWRQTLQEVIFGTYTPAGKLFDVLLIFSIVSSVAVVMLDSVSSINGSYGPLLYQIEWFFTLLFLLEYLLRLISVGSPIKYATSFFGVIDLLAILPTFIGLVIPSGRYLTVIRILRVLRIFRVLKLVQYIGESHQLMLALKASRPKITVFLFAVMVLVVFFGSLMYVIEGVEHGFTSIPRSVYWAIVTLTTVGYGDISPQTSGGQAIAAMIMILGYGIIAVPTGIVTVELNKAHYEKQSDCTCYECGSDSHDQDAKFCKICGSSLVCQKNEPG